MFSTIDEIFHNRTISFQQTVSTLSLSNYHSPGADPHQPHCNTHKILFTFQKIFLFLPIKFYEKPVSLIYKLTNPRPI